MLWEVEIRAADPHADREGLRVLSEAVGLGLRSVRAVESGRSFLIEADADEAAIQAIAANVLADPVVETFVVRRLPAARVSAEDEAGGERLLNVLFKPGVTDNVGLSARDALAAGGLPVSGVATVRTYRLNADAEPGEIARLRQKALANDAIEEVREGPLQLESIAVGRPYRFELRTVPIRNRDDAALLRVSEDGQLSLSVAEMRVIRDHFESQEREPTDCELETIAQTWSEHCSHKTLAGRIRYTDENGSIEFQNMLKETVFAATQTIRKRLGADDWCVSVFEDNAGVVRFDDDTDVCIKVETHNRPSAIEPYGGANTGLGGVIRDTLGTGVGGRPVCSTDVFCFAPPDVPNDALPPGVLHPKTVMRGVVAGVRDYGNRMGIPTVNGAICFDDRYVGNPLVFCGNVAMLPAGKQRIGVRPGDLIVALGGRTGRDGIHGATFSSAELTDQSETVSGGAVQIGNAITEKMLADVLIAARDRGLFTSLTDCGAGGFSSAIGEMGEKTGAEVDLDAAPLKYEGLSYTEIWISEAQERMVLAVPPENADELIALAAAEGVEATVLGRFTDTRRLVLRYEGTVVGDLSMAFLHDGRPPIVREATFAPPASIPLSLGRGARGEGRSDAPGTFITVSAPAAPAADRSASGIATGARPSDANPAPSPPAPLPRERGDNAHRRFDADLRAILAAGNVCSKEWVIRQYDHEVQGGSVVKPLVGVDEDGPSDAAVVRPNLGSPRGLVVGCGINPRFGELDPYYMAAGAIDEAIRNCVAVGADPGRIAILDNFCWGNTDRPETLGSLVRAALGCRDAAIAFGTPFVSGKDSLKNEFSYAEADGTRRTISIPPTLLITALGQIDDVAAAVTMDLKRAGSVLYLVGTTRAELGGSHYALVNGLTGGQVPTLDPAEARGTFAAIHEAIRRRLLRSCHDLSEGGLAVAAAETAFAGGLGLALDLTPAANHFGLTDTATLLFSESNSRFLIEADPARGDELEAIFRTLSLVRLGAVTEEPRLVVHHVEATVLDSPLDELKAAWQGTLAWD